MFQITIFDFSVSNNIIEEYINKIISFHLV